MTVLIQLSEQNALTLVMEKEGHGILKSSESTKPGLSCLRLVFTSDGVGVVIGVIRELMT